VRGSADLDAILGGIGLTFKPHENGQLRADEDPKSRWSVTPEEGWMLAAFASGRRVLEFGSGIGVSAAFMAETALSVVTIDPDPWVHATVNLPGNTTQVTSFEASKTYAPFDVAFIDGDHETPSVLRDIYDALSILPRPAVIGFHDMSHRSVRAALSLASERFAWAQTLPTAGKLTFAGTR